MTTRLIIYHERLGDIARCLPLARHLAKDGGAVFMECKPEYHGLFEMVSYCQPVAPGHELEFGEVVNPQIWPSRYQDFMARGWNWMDYVYEPWPECDRQIVFDVTPSAFVPDDIYDSVVVFPSGYSQMRPPDPNSVILHAHAAFSGDPVIVIGKRDLGYHQLDSIPDLCAWIKAAKHVLTVNTAPSILASGLRDSWHHIPDLDYRHDWLHANQIIVPRNERL